MWLKLIEKKTTIENESKWENREWQRKKCKKKSPSTKNTIATKNIRNGRFMFRFNQRTKNIQYHSILMFFFSLFFILVCFCFVCMLLKMKKARKNTQQQLFIVSTLKLFHFSPVPKNTKFTFTINKSENVGRLWYFNNENKNTNTNNNTNGKEINATILVFNWVGAVKIHTALIMQIVCGKKKRKNNWRCLSSDKLLAMNSKYLKNVAVISAVYEQKEHQIRKKNVREKLRRWATQMSDTKRTRQSEWEWDECQSKNRSS